MKYRAVYAANKKSGIILFLVLFMTFLVFHLVLYCFMKSRRVSCEIQPAPLYQLTQLTDQRTSYDELSDQGYTSLQTSGVFKSGQLVSEKVKLTYFDVHLSQTI